MKKIILASLLCCVAVFGMIKSAKEFQNDVQDMSVAEITMKIKDETLTTGGKYDDYEKTSSLTSETASTEVLVRFDGILYGKSYAIIDYAGGSEAIGVIDKLIDREYVPKIDGETNTEEILNANVFSETDRTIVLQYNHEYVLFEKIEE